MKKTISLPNYTFDVTSAMIMFLGGILPLIGSVFIAVAYQVIFKVDAINSPTFMVLSNLFMWLGAIWSYDYFVCQKQTGQALKFDLHSPDIVTYLLVFPMMFGMMLVAEYFTSLIPVTGSFFGPMYEMFTKMMEPLISNTTLMYVLAVLMAPIFEEIVFRGIIQKGLVNRGIAPIKAILISSILFGLVHFNLWQFVGAVLLGMVLGFVYERTKTLLLPILLHGFNNLLSTLMVTYYGQESFTEVLGVSEVIILQLGIVIFLLSFYLFRKKYPVKTLDQNYAERDIDSHS